MSDQPKKTAEEIVEAWMTQIEVGGPMAKDLRLEDLVRGAMQQARNDGGREAYVLGYMGGHNDTVEGKASLDPGERWDEDEQLREDAGGAS